MEQSDFDGLIQLLGLPQSSEYIDLLRAALTSRASSGEDSTGQRLAYFGDSLLDWTISKYFLLNQPKATPQLMTELTWLVRSKVVLALIVEHLGIDKHLIVTEPEATAIAQGRKRSILSEAFESIIGVLIVKRDVEYAGQFVERLLYPICTELINADAHRHPKVALDHHVRQKFHKPIQYRTRRVRGRSRDVAGGVWWNSKCLVGKRLLAESSGHGKDHAEYAATLKALASVFQVELLNPIDIVMKALKGK